MALLTSLRRRFPDTAASVRWLRIHPVQGPHVDAQVSNLRFAEHLRNHEQELFTLHHLKPQTVKRLTQLFGQLHNLAVDRASGLRR